MSASLMRSRRILPKSQGCWRGSSAWNWSLQAAGQVRPQPCRTPAPPSSAQAGPALPCPAQPSSAHLSPAPLCPALPRPSPSPTPPRCVKEGSSKQAEGELWASDDLWKGCLGPGCYPTRWGCRAREGSLAATPATLLCQAGVQPDRANRGGRLW